MTEILIPDYEKVCDRASTYYSQWGKVGGVGYTSLNNYEEVDPNGSPALSIIYNSIFAKIEDIPRVFEGWPVRVEEVGDIVAQTKAIPAQSYNQPGTWTAKQEFDKIAKWRAKDHPSEKASYADAYKIVSDLRDKYEKQKEEFDRTLQEGKNELAELLKKKYLDKLK